MVSKKNETNIMVKNALDVIFGGLSYWMFGFAFSRGESDQPNSFSGTANFFADASQSRMGSVFALYFFQASFATTATTIVSGAVAERANLQAYMVFSFTNTLAFCFPAYWVWGKHGWLKKLGVIDVGGASPVHLVGGVAGLVGTIMLKPRRNKFTGVGLKQKMASPTNVLLGTFMLWWGWLGFNCGSTFGVSGGKWKLASRSAVCTLNASIGGGIFAHLFGVLYLKRVDVPTLMSGILGSLVSITAICAVARPGESIFIGLVGSAISVLGWQLLERLKIDDPVSAIPTHAGSAIWGMLAVGLFVEQDRLEDFSETYGVFKGGHIKVLGVQLLACLTIGLWSAFVAFAQFYIIGRFIHFRFSEYEERLGADFCEHAVDHSTERLTPGQLERMRAALANKNKLTAGVNQDQDSNKGLALFRSVALALRGVQRSKKITQSPKEKRDDNKTGLARFRSVVHALRGPQRSNRVTQFQAENQDDPTCENKRGPVGLRSVVLGIKGNQRSENDISLATKDND
ncbi:putative ammonium transporter 3 [Orbicella faveolata]|uniref:putative ammonium transporter 3 n=1 Tax=Orbicella faveolata TaxID=48498 RepID=UPI0009E18B71|nr:putative ammonium transporter 3 [Orbicella faveolata]